MWQGIAVAAIPVVAGVAFMWKRTGKVLSAMKELGDVLTIIPKALEDQKLSPAEMGNIKKEIAEALAAFKSILK